jgi:hypothetical protein
MNQTDNWMENDVANFNTPVDDIGGELVNLALVLEDQSTSMNRYVQEMIVANKEFKDGLISSKDVDDLLLARGNFRNHQIDIGGYKAIKQFDTDYIADGSTPLYDAIKEAKEKLFVYMDYLKSQGQRVKAVFSVFSDGEDVCSYNSFDVAKQCVDELNQREVVTAWIGFGQNAMDEGKRLGFKNMFDIVEESKKQNVNLGSMFRHAYGCLSKSVVSNSQSSTQKVDDFFDVT